MNQQVAAIETKRTSADIEAELASLESVRGVEEEEEQGIASSNAVDLAAKEAERENAVLLAEAEAGRQGWVPKKLYKGDASKWVDAATFIQRGERFNSNLQREVHELRKKLEGFEGTKKAFMKFHEDSIAAKDVEIAANIKELRIQRSEATRNGQDELAISLEDRIDLLSEQRKEVKKLPAEATDEVKTGEAVAAAANLPNPVLDEWVEDGNAWFRDDPQLRSYAIALGDTLIKNGETLRGRKFLDLVTSHMAEDFPRKFKKPKEEGNAGGGNAVEGAGGGSGGKSAGGGRTERDLPAEDLALMKQFIREGWTTKEKFLASYFAKNKS